LEPLGHIPIVALSQAGAELFHAVEAGLGFHQGGVAACLGKRREVLAVLVLDELDQENLLVVQVLDDRGNCILAGENRSPSAPGAKHKLKTAAGFWVGPHDHGLHETDASNRLSQFLERPFIVVLSRIARAFIHEVKRQFYDCLTGLQFHSIVSWVWLLRKGQAASAEFALRLKSG
jgi:hypothetical protein